MAGHVEKSLSLPLSTSPGNLRSPSAGPAFLKGSRKPIVPLEGVPATAQLRVSDQQEGKDEGQAGARRSGRQIES